MMSLLMVWVMVTDRTWKLALKKRWIPFSVVLASVECSSSAASSYTPLNLTANLILVSYKLFFSEIQILKTIQS